MMLAKMKNMIMAKVRSLSTKSMDKCNSVAHRIVDEVLPNTTKVKKEKVIVIPLPKKEEKEEEKIYVAVFGNEKSGMCRSKLLKGATYIGSGHTKKRFSMISRGYPMIFDSPCNGYVKVEVYEIDTKTLKRLDGYHSVGFVTDRREEFIDILGQKMKANIFIAKERWDSKEWAFPLPNYGVGFYEWQGTNIAVNQKDLLSSTMLKEVSALDS